VRERRDAAAEAAWGRREVLVSRDGNAATDDLNTDGDAALADGAENARLASNVSDTPDQRYGVHYNLGDKVAIESWPGEQLVDVVRTVHIQATATSGDYISATIGSQAATSDPLLIRRLRELNDRVGRLERNVVPAT
jgi:hypothetical protein